jgi:hypothetical protein
LAGWIHGRGDKMAVMSPRETAKRWKISLWDLLIVTSWTCIGLAILRFSSTADPVVLFYGHLAAWIVFGATIGDFVARVVGNRFGGCSAGCGGCFGLVLGLVTFLLYYALPLD